MKGWQKNVQNPGEAKSEQVSADLSWKIVVTKLSKPVRPPSGRPQSVPLLALSQLHGLHRAGHHQRRPGHPTGDPARADDLHDPARGGRLQGARLARLGDPRAGLLVLLWLRWGKKKCLGFD